MKEYAVPPMRDYLLMEDLPEDDRPREKAMRYGVRSLSKAELIAIIFGNGMRGKSVLTMSQELLANNNGRLSDIASKSIKEVIRENSGIGPAKAIALAAAIELGMRCQAETPAERIKIKQSTDVYNVMRVKLQRLVYEEFWVVLINRGNEIIGEICISQGGTAATVVDIKLLYRRVMEYGHVVSGIVLVHNHPSGTCRPSGLDDSLTKRIKGAGELLDIKVIDHLIITPSNYFSYADEGVL